MWRYENFFRLARELPNKSANSLFISLSSISDTLVSIQAQLIPLRLIACGQAVHLQRSAISGSTFVARRAGIQHASSATKVSSSGITMNVSGSVGVIP